MTGDDLAREVQARCDVRVAEAVAAERQRIVAALTRWLEISRGSWPHDGRIAWAEVARWVRWIADCGPSGAQTPLDAPCMESHQPHPESRSTAATGGGNGHPRRIDDPHRPLLTPSTTRDPNATVPWEAFDHTHPDHDDFVRTAGRCFAAGCPRHDPNGEPR